MDAAEEKELVARAREDRQAFGTIYEEFYSLVFHYALKRVGNVKVAEDVTADTFYNALKNIWRFEWQNVPFSSWLYRIATNEVNRYFRLGKHRTFPLECLHENGFDPAAQVNIEDELDSAEADLQRYKDFLEIQKRLNKLPLKYQEVIALRFFENKKVNEISKILGKKEGTVKSLLSRGIDKLRENWEWDNVPGRIGLQPFPYSSIVKRGEAIISVRERGYE